VIFYEEIFPLPKEGIANEKTEWSNAQIPIILEDFPYNIVTNNHKNHSPTQRKNLDVPDEEEANGPAQSGTVGKMSRPLAAEAILGK